MGAESSHMTHMGHGSGGPGRNKRSAEGAGLANQGDAFVSSLKDIAKKRGLQLEHMRIPTIGFSRALLSHQARSFVLERDEARTARGSKLKLFIGETTNGWKMCPPPSLGEQDMPGNNDRELQEEHSSTPELRRNEASVELQPNRVRFGEKTLPSLPVCRVLARELQGIENRMHGDDDGGAQGRSSNLQNAYKAHDVRVDQGSFMCRAEMLGDSETRAHGWQGSLVSPFPSDMIPGSKTDAHGGLEKFSLALPAGFEDVVSGAHGGRGSFMSALCISINQLKIRRKLLKTRHDLVKPQNLCCAIGGLLAFTGNASGNASEGMQESEVSKVTIRHEAMMGLSSKDKSLYMLLRGGSHLHPPYKEVCDSCQQINLQEKDVQAIVELSGCCVLLENKAGKALFKRCRVECEGDCTSEDARNAACLRLCVDCENYTGLENLNIGILRLDAGGRHLPFDSDKKFLTTDSTPLAFGDTGPDKTLMTIDSDGDESEQCSKPSVGPVKVLVSKITASSARAAKILQQAVAQRVEGNQGAVERRGRVSTELPSAMRGNDSTPSQVTCANQTKELTVVPDETECLFPLPDWKPVQVHDNESSVALSVNDVRTAAKANEYLPRTLIGCMALAMNMKPPENIGKAPLYVCDNQPYRVPTSMPGEHTAALVWKLNTCHALQALWATHQWQNLTLAHQGSSLRLKDLGRESPHARLYMAVVFSPTILWDSYWVSNSEKEESEAVGVRVHPGRGVLYGRISCDKGTTVVTDWKGRPHRQPFEDYHAHLFHLSTVFEGFQGSHYIAACALDVENAPQAYANAAQDSGKRSDKGVDSFCILAADSMGGEMAPDMKQNLILTMCLLGNNMRKTVVAAPDTVKSSGMATSSGHVAAAVHVPGSVHQKALTRLASSAVVRFHVPLQESTTCALHTACNIKRLAGIMQTDVSNPDKKYPHPNSCLWNYRRVGRDVQGQMVKVGATRLEAACTLLWLRKQILVGVRDAQYVLRSGKADLIDLLETSIARMTDTSTKGNAGDRKKAIEAKDEVWGEPWEICDNSRDARDKLYEYKQ